MEKAEQIPRIRNPPLGGYPLLSTFWASGQGSHKHTQSRWPGKGQWVTWTRDAGSCSSHCSDHVIRGTTAAFCAPWLFGSTRPPGKVWACPSGAAEGQASAHLHLSYTTTGVWETETKWAHFVLTTWDLTSLLKGCSLLCLVMKN